VDLVLGHLDPSKDSGGPLLLATGCVAAVGLRLPMGPLTQCFKLPAVFLLWLGASCSVRRC